MGRSESATGNDSSKGEVSKYSLKGRLEPNTLEVVAIAAVGLVMKIHQEHSPQARDPLRND